MLLLRLRHYLEYLAVRVFVCVLQALRPETCHALARRLAWIFTDIAPIRRAVVDENLQIAFPEWNARRRHACRRGMWEHLLLFIAEVAQSPRRIHITNYRDHIEFRNHDVFGRTMFDK